MMSKKKSQVAMATAAALLFGQAAVNGAVASEAKVSCVGVNTCKGQSACKSARNDCKGQNACKGLGFVELTQQDCQTAKDKIQAPAKNRG